MLSVVGLVYLSIVIPSQLMAALDPYPKSRTPHFVEDAARSCVFISSDHPEP
jgi:hypothetical protein